MYGSDSLPWNFVERNYKGINRESWHIYELSENTNLYWYFVRCHPKGLNVYIKLDFVEVICRDKRLSSNPKINCGSMKINLMEHLAHPERLNGKQSDMYGLNHNTNLSKGY